MSISGKLNFLAYLNENFSTLKTSMGDTNLTFAVDEKYFYRNYYYFYSKIKREGFSSFQQYGWANSDLHVSGLDLYSLTKPDDFQWYDLNHDKL